MLMDGITLTTTGTASKSDGTSLITSNYDLAGCTFSQPTASAVLFRFIVNREFTIPSGWTGSVATSQTAAAATTVYTINRIRSGVSTAIGTITFATSGTTGTFANGAGETTTHQFAIGDIITVVAPSTVDVNHNNIMWTLSGSTT